jgi:hypothetical protein
MKSQFALATEDCHTAFFSPSLRLFVDIGLELLMLPYAFLRANSTTQRGLFAYPEEFPSKMFDLKPT